MSEMSGQCHEAVKLAIDAWPRLIVAGASDADIMVTIETIVAVGILFNEQAFGVSREVSAERLEVMVERVMERIAAKAAGENQHGR